MPETVTAIILAGGRATRMGGEDKGLIALAGRPMIAHVLDAVRPQVDAIIINANRNHERYAAFGLPVVADREGGFQGPLAGMASGLAHCDTPLALTLPCDGPLVPADLVARLRAALGDGDAAVAHDGERLQPAHALLRAPVLPSLERFLADGGRKIDRWYASLDVREADFSGQRELFINVNTPEEHARLEARLDPGRETTTP
ncbi:molybdenum cofactor guanylyltransferase MobA [Sediminicurvatus halobius]|uniref:Molybdenum cofactor guanylyltransferase n=1 Tax=Sediminicurvatus halobius TaxID=2182432 RepID=A0A2U2MZR1_9GAMM|nr:molybdenum cofactor guanylyltransferase MobA [Spiribacter halobius]PWG62214.1 molybdenum cofactor guanylyltransferase MobA [Spiribacter halobius]UEX78120.1 molybdenum cofactor guanylyltransferase [Spiribacter halobius]